MKFKDLKQFIFLNPFLNRPFFFNGLRYLVTGNQRSLKEFVRKNLEKYHCQSVLDICCGTGDFVPKNGINYIGIDINPHFIAFAQKKYGNQKTRFIKGDVLNLLHFPKKFDACLLISTLHHFPDSQVNRILEKVEKVTEKLVIIVDLIPYPSNPIKRFFVLLDQGDFVRREKQKEKIVSGVFKIKSTCRLLAGLAEQYGIIAEPRQ